MALECFNCMKQFDILKYLFCNHAFCNDCLKRLKQQITNTEAIIVCPFDKRTTTLSKGLDERSLKSRLGVHLECEDCSESRLSDKCWWCESCTKTVCSTCAMKSHRSHKCNFWDDYAIVKKCFAILKPYVAETKHINGNIHEFCTQLETTLHSHFMQGKICDEFLNTCSRTFGNFKFDEQVDSVTDEKTSEKIINIVWNVLKTYDPKCQLPKIDVQQQSLLKNKLRLFQLPHPEACAQLFFPSNNNAENLLLACVENVKLSNHQTVGKNIKFFDDLGKCFNLKRLLLPQCDLRVECIRLLTRTMEDNKFPHLETLDLSNNVEIGKDVQFFTTLVQCHKLQQLKLRNSKITPECLHILSAFGLSRTFLHLVLIDLGGNESVGNNVELFYSLSKKGVLKSLTLDSCKVTPESCEIFKSGCNSNAFLNLREINLSYNNQIGKEFAMFRALSYCRKLTHMYFAYCGLSNQSIEALTKNISSNSFPNLEVLFLSENFCLGPAKEFFSTLKCCTKLKVLSLSNCKLTSESVDVLADNVNCDAFENMEELYFNFNIEVGKQVSLFTALTNKCKNLTILGLLKCHLTRQSLEAVNTLRNLNPSLKLEFDPKNNV